MTTEMIKQIERDYWAEKADPIDMAEVFDLAQRALEQEPKPMVEIDLYSVIKQKYIEREVLDKIRDEIEQITDTMGVSYNQYVSKIDVLQIIDKYKAESEEE